MYNPSEETKAHYTDRFIKCVRQIEHRWESSDKAAFALSLRQTCSLNESSILYNITLRFRHGVFYNKCYHSLNSIIFKGY